MRAIYLIAAMVALTQAAVAQNPFVYKPIDANKLIVEPTDATSVIGRTMLGRASRTVAGAIENNGFVRTINNLLGRRARDPVVQPGFSPLPPTGSFQSTTYPNTFAPRMPLAQPFGRSAPITTPGTSAQR